ncbi:uncharacterized protein LOC128549916, partial [Mercenaria mercenaria]|uniref:uncharacterized protein LOC128549916 n=1 Tax=Mercenaria mercenaria TaxID=6596 RepID=UPI00234F197B
TPKEWTEYEPVTKCKQKDLKQQGRGNKPHPADEITDEEINLLYDAHQLGPASPSPLIDTLWFNNTLHFGMRTGAAEHRNLCWGDLKLHYDDDLKCEYTEYHERQTKTHTCEGIRIVRTSNARMYATAVENRCPVMIYKKYASKRPCGMQNDDSPIYLASITNSEQPAEERERLFIS